MKKRFLAIAIASGLASPFAANADATVYGIVHMTVGMVDTGTGGTDNWQVDSVASRLGFKGSEDLGNGMTATYKLEYGVDPDAGGPGQVGGSTTGLSRRNQYVGLKGGFGEVRVGRHDTPLKMSQGKFDQFNDTRGDIRNVGAADLRVDNAIAYMNKFTDDFTFAIALVPGEGDGVTAGDGPADTISVAGMYASGPLYVALAMDSYDDTGNSGMNASGMGVIVDSTTRLTVTYKMGKMQFGFLMENQTGITGQPDLDGMGFSFGMGMGKNKAKFQYLTGEIDNNGGDTTNLSVGYDWGLSKRTTAYVQYTTQETEVGSTTTSELDFMGVGLKHKF
mgnify:FL=1